MKTVPKPPSSRRRAIDDGVKAVLLSSISHDFTEPLGWIYLLKNALKRDSHDQQTHWIYEEATEIAKAINTMVEEFVNSAEIDGYGAWQLIDAFEAQLREPLRALLSIGRKFAGRKLGSNLPAESTTIERAAWQMIRLIEGMATFVRHAQPSQSQQEGDRGPFGRPAEIARDVLELVRRSSGDTGLDLFVSDVLRQHRDPYILDPGQVRTALQNLLSNSIKYSDFEKDKPRVQLSVRLVDIDLLPSTAVKFLKSAARQRGNGLWKGGWLWFHVHDNGVGIPKNELGQVTRLYIRGSNVAKRFVGRGMGLAIVRAYAEAVGGTLVLESELGESTDAHFIIPARRA